MKNWLKLFMSLWIMCMVSLSISESIFAENISYYKYKGFVYTDAISIGRYADRKVVNYKGKKEKITIPSQIDGEKIEGVINFRKAKQVKEMYIPSTVLEIDIACAPKLKKVIISADNKWFQMKNNLVLNKEGTEVCACPGGLKKVKIPDTVHTIGLESFWGAKVEKVVLGNEVKIIDSSTFANCKKLSSIKLNDKLAIIESRAFEKCTKLEEIVLRGNVEKISHRSFASCKKLQRVVIKGTITPQIESDVFTGTKKGIKFYVINEKVAKQLKEELVESGVVDASIYVGTVCIYSQIDGTKSKEALILGQAVQCLKNCSELGKLSQFFSPIESVLKMNFEEMLKRWK